ncbi:NACHT, LRR and PYD domains-containing protein 3-like [Brachyhypopomus gauderio]|uniref:NACHT, LRR and PYD domains-containing protein 3-like n=1 Tax=Brachyhypopomus gauderio TaxID=698409 RepID=UPI0040423499
MLINSRRVIADCSIMCFTETWLNEDVPDSTVHVDGFTLHRADRTEASLKTKGGGLCCYVNQRWCTDTTMISRTCSSVLETLTIECRPFYLPRELKAIILVAVYIPPQAPSSEAAQLLSTQITDIENLYPDSTVLVLGDFNHVNLKQSLPRFKQQIRVPTSFTQAAAAADMTPDQTAQSMTTAAAVSVETIITAQSGASVCTSVLASNTFNAPVQIVFNPGTKPGVKDIQTIFKKHKTRLRKKFKFINEGTATSEESSLLNKMYTELYVTESCSSREGDGQHELQQLERPSKTQTPRQTPISCNDIFKHFPVCGTNREIKGEEEDEEDEEEEEIKIVLTKGIAGIGKTVSVQKFILDWTLGKTNQDIDLMIVMPFRELNLIKGNQHSLHRLICVFNPELKELHTEVFEDVKIVFIFDGLDEFHFPLNFRQHLISDVTEVSSVDVLITNLIKGHLLHSALIWITSRPAATGQIPSKFINRKTEMHGFRDPQKEEYFRKRIRNQLQAELVISSIKKSKSLYIMCQIPVFCWISAEVLRKMVEQDNIGSIPKTLTEMYINFLLLQTNVRNQKYDENEELDTNQLLKRNRGILLKLAKLAFIQLMKGNLIFYNEDLQECGVDVINDLENSGVCAEVLQKESVLYQRKVYCFVHLSFQEFLAAFYIFQCYLIRDIDVLTSFLTVRQYDTSQDRKMVVFLKGAIEEALMHRSGRLDLFLRFLLGISLQSNQRLLQGLLTHTEGSSESIKEIMQYIKKKLYTQDPSVGNSINLFLCLLEINDQALYREIQDYLCLERSTTEKHIPPALCSVIAYMLQMSEEVLDELNPQNYNMPEDGQRRLLLAVSNCRKALLARCKLTERCCEVVSAALQAENSPLRELDLSDNYGIETGAKQLSDGLKSSHCKLEILRLCCCSIADESCQILASVMAMDFSHLRELDISNNDLQDPGVEKLAVGLGSLHCKLETLRLTGCNLTENFCDCLALALHKEKTFLIELDLSNSKLQDSAVQQLSVGLNSSYCKLKILRLASCKLTVECCKYLASALQTKKPSLQELDLTNNNLQDSGVEQLSAGLNHSDCKLETLRLAGNNLTVESCQYLTSVLQKENSCLLQLDLNNNNLQDSGVEQLSAGLKSSHCKLKILRMALCSLGEKTCENLASVLTNSLLRELDLSNNDLKNSGVVKLSVGLKSSHCKLEILRLSGCLVTEEGCTSLASALRSNPSHLKELDLTYNNPGESGIKLLSARWEDTLETLRVENESEFTIKPGLRKYVHMFTLDPNIAHRRLTLSEGNRKVTHVKKEWLYADHQDRFEHYGNVLSRESVCGDSVCGRCYWEAEWSGDAVEIAVTYKGISRKGRGFDCEFGRNEKSWSLNCCKNTYTDDDDDEQSLHNNKSFVIPVSSSNSNRVGVYVDWPAGTLSFYSVSSHTHTLTHLHTFNSTFTQPLYAGFWVGLFSSVRVLE